MGEILDRLLLAGCRPFPGTQVCMRYVGGAPSRERQGQFPKVPSFALYGEPSLFDLDIERLDQLTLVSIVGERSFGEGGTFEIDDGLMKL